MKVATSVQIVNRCKLICYTHKHVIISIKARFLKADMMELKP